MLVLKYEIIKYFTTVVCSRCSSLAKLKVVFTRNIGAGQSLLYFLSILALRCTKMRAEKYSYSVLFNLMVMNSFTRASYRYDHYDCFCPLGLSLHRNTKDSCKKHNNRPFLFGLMA